MSVVTRLALGLGLCQPSGPLVAQTFSCRSAREHAVVLLKDHIIRLVSAPASDTLLANTRDRYSLPAIAASSVAVETKKQRCQAAAQAYHEALHPGVPQVSRKVVVIKVGISRYVVLDPADTIAGEYQSHVVFDAQWAVLAVFDG